MTFDEILEQAIEMLQRRGRLTYRTLKRQFQLDDEALEDLKFELIEGQRLATDENGTVLIWTCNTVSGQAVTPQLTQPIPQPAVQEQPSQQVAPLPTAPPPDAERRQLTVMFCDLVDSTTLSSQLDPEEYRDVVRAYQTACTEVIRRYDGHIAQLLGDGLLVYFGYPQAHEDDAHRAVRTGLGLLAAMKDLQTGLHQDKGIQLALRVGIHTGLVVVGAMGSGDRQEQLALGETPNIAARIQGLAAPNTLVISEATSRLVEGYFTCESLGEPTLRGVSQPLKVYRVLEASGVTSRLDIVQPRGLTPLVGRAQEVGLLLERWAQVKAGHGHVVLLTGDAGIGKSRLVQMLKDHVTNEPHMRWECRSSPYFENTALFPLTDLFQRLLRFEAHDTPDEKLGKLEQLLSQHRLPLAESVPLFAPLLSLPIPEERYPALPVSPQRQRQKTLETLVAILLEHAERQPVLFILEDLHWADPTTLELLHLVIEQIPTTSVCMVLTCRPTFQPSWSHRSYVSEITVSRLSHAQVAQIVTGMTDGKTLPPEVLQQIIAKTDGVPLFIEEMTKAILESGHLTEVDGHYKLTESLSTFAIPATLQDSLMARLDRLMTGKVIAQLGATLGRQFSYALLQAVAQLNDRTLHEEVHRLVEAEIVYQRGLPPQTTYTFKHALIQDAAYASLLKSTRQQYHQRIAQVLEEQFPETVETQPELLAHHYTEAGLSVQASLYWQRAGQRAVERSANLEAVAHLTKGLELLATLPDTPERAQQELVVQLTLGSALIVTKGYAAPEVLQAYARARELCQQVGESTQLFPVLRGLWNFYLHRVELQTARELGEQLLTLAQHVDAPALLLEAHRALGSTCNYLGEFAAAQAHFEQEMALYDRQRHDPHAFRYGQDAGVHGRSYAALTLWWLGYPDQALQRSHEALTLARELAHPFSVGFALTFAAWLHHFRREGRLTQERAEAAIALGAEQGFVLWSVMGRIFGGWALAEWYPEPGAGQRHVEEGMAQIQQGLAAWHAMGSEVFQPYGLALLAEASARVGQPEAGLTLLAEALAVTNDRGERRWEAEIHRLKGELLLAGSAEPHVEAETCFRQALNVARRQQAKSWELRAAMSLARLWQQQGKRQEAHDLLAPVYGWFTEGFDTADLQEAKALLDELGG